MQNDKEKCHNKLTSSAVVHVLSCVFKIDYAFWMKAMNKRENQQGFVYEFAVFIYEIGKFVELYAIRSSDWASFLEMFNLYSLWVSLCVGNYDESLIVPVAKQYRVCENYFKNNYPKLYSTKTQGLTQYSL